MANKKNTKGADLRVITEEHPEFVAKTAQFLTKHSDIVGYLAVGIVVLCAVGFLMQMNSRAKEEEASAHLQNAFKQLSKDRATNSISLTATTEDGKETDAPEIVAKAKAIGAFESVYDNYPGTRSGQNALYMVGFSQLQNGKLSEAIESFNSFTQKFSNSPLAGSCLLGKATAEFNLGQAEQSLATLKSIESTYPDYYLMDVVMFEQAKRHEALNDMSKAKTMYTRVVEEYPDSQWKTMSDTALEKLDKENPESNSNENA